MLLSGRSERSIDYFIYSSGILFLIIIFLSVNFIAPLKMNENNQIIKNIQTSKPYLFIEPFVFNKVGKDYYVYFTGFGKNKEEIKNVVVYKMKKGRLDSIAHVDKGYVDNANNLILSNGISVFIGDAGEIGSPVYLDDSINKHEIIENGYIEQAFPDLDNIVENFTSLQLLDKLKQSKGLTSYFIVYEINRRLSVVLAIIFLIILIRLLFESSFLVNYNNAFVVSTVVTFIFIFREIYIKMFLKYLLYSIFINIWLVDILSMALITGLFIAGGKYFKKLYKQ